MIRADNVVLIGRCRRAFGALAAMALALPGQLHAQRPLREQVAVRHANTDQVAWSLPDVNDLVERVYRRIVTQDMPGAIRMSEYTQRSFGREETVNAVRRFTGRDIELAPSAFSPLDGWMTGHGQDVTPCTAPADACLAAPNTVWIAITRFERGDTQNELYVWYTTRFAAHRADQPVSNAYAFCERWFRIGGNWKYEGFIRVTGA